MTVEPRTDDDELLHCIVEIPKGSRNKYEWDERLGAIKLDRFLFSSLVYPTDYGYIPKTLADDGDALDVMVIVSEATLARVGSPLAPRVLAQRSRILRPGD